MINTKICKCKGGFVGVNTSVCPPYCIKCGGFLEPLTYSELRGLARHTKPFHDNQRAVLQEFFKKEEANENTKISNH